MNSEICRYLKTLVLFLNVQMNADLEDAPQVLVKFLSKNREFLSFRQLSVFWAKIGPKTNNNHLKVSMGIQVYNNITL